MKSQGNITWVEFQNEKETSLSKFQWNMNLTKKYCL